jgi:hypothetical protein
VITWPLFLTAYVIEERITRRDAYKRMKAASTGILSWHEGARMLIDYRSLVGFK